MQQPIETIPAKTIVTRAKSSAWFGMDYNMNIYRGCSHGCIYCDSRSDCYGDATFETVKAKADALALIRSDLQAKRLRGVVSTGAMSDPYNPREAELQLTRQALALLLQYGFGVSIATKSSLVTRDIDMLKAIQAHAPVLVKLTITTPNDSLSSIIEPHAPPSSFRFDAIARLADAGLYCGVLLMPVLPFLTDEESSIIKLLHMAKQSGAAFVYPSFGVTLRDSQRAYYYAQLDAHFPGVRHSYQRLYGNNYACSSPHAAALWQAFARECEALGLRYRMRDIVAGYRGNYAQQQVSLFD